MDASEKKKVRGALETGTFLRKSRAHFAAVFWRRKNAVADFDFAPGPIGAEGAAGQAQFLLGSEEDAGGAANDVLFDSLQ